MAAKNLNLRLRGRERRSMNEIDHALERTEKNESDMCVSFGDDIALERLEVHPVTAMCIDETPYSD